MLLCILIRWVVFDIVFRDDFSTFLQSFLVVVVHMGVMIRNPKTDLKLEFGGPKTVEERVGCARGQVRPKWPTLCPTRSTRGSHGKGSFWSFVFLSLISLKCIPIPSHSCFKQNSKSEFFLQFLVSCFDHNFFIRTQNWMIQKWKLLVSKRSTNPK